MDGITASLLKEAGVAPVNAPAGTAWQIPASVQAGRDAEARKIVSRETGGGGIPTAAVVDGSTAGTAAAPKFDPITASLLQEANAVPIGAMPANVADRVPGVKPQVTEAPKAEPSLMDKMKGGAEVLLSMGTGALASVPAQVGGVLNAVTGGKFGTPEGVRMGEQRAAEIQNSLTYQPRAEIAKEALGKVGEVLDATKMQGLGPTEGIALGSVMSQPLAARRVAAAKPTAAPGMASAGASAADNAAQARGAVQAASPELQAVVEKELGRKGGTVNVDVLKRHVEADTLPVPIQLTKGQATQDVGLISQEQNSRGAKEATRNRFNEQNKQLIENTNAIRESAAPDVFVTTKPQQGELIIDAYKAKDAALNKDISSKYKALSDANGGNLPLDARTLVRNADAALHKELLYDHVPKELRSTLDRLAAGGTGVGGGMTFENFESLRTNLARIQRSPNVDGNVKAAAAVIRGELESMPMPPGAENLKPLADAARAAARNRFALIDADPAYKAVVRGQASADKFIDKYIIGSDLKNVETMKTNLAHDPVAQQTMAAGTINQLKRSAGIIDNQGNFSQAGYNKALENIRAKLPVIFEPEQRQQLEALGNVARYTQAQPRGSFVNNSNTLTAAVAEGAKNAAEGAANVAAHGLPVGTYGRKIISGIKERKAINEALQTGAGIRLQSVGGKK